MIVAGTGHRPSKLLGYGNTAAVRVQDLARAVLQKYQPDRVISGMALGWDIALAKAALELGFPLVAAVPFSGQELRWAEKDRENYGAILERAESIHVVSPSGYSVQAMQSRNIWMVDHSDLVLALWNGSPSGTAHCVQYALRSRKPIINLWRSWERYGGGARSG